MLIHVFAIQQEMSELLYKQMYVQIEILKKIFQGSCKPTKKVCDENASKKKKMTTA